MEQDKKPTVAIIGASADRSKFGNKAVRAYLAKGYRVFPVNPKGGTVEGLPVYKSVLDIPESIDRVTLYVPPEVAERVLDEIAEKGCGELWFNPGSENEAVLEKARRLGFDPIVACSIVAIGADPNHPDRAD